MLLTPMRLSLSPTSFSMLPFHSGLSQSTLGTLDKSSFHDLLVDSRVWREARLCGRGSGRVPASTSGAAGRSANSILRLGGGGGDRRGAARPKLTSARGRRARGAAAPEAGGAVAGVWEAALPPGLRWGFAQTLFRGLRQPGAVAAATVLRRGPRNCPTQRERGLSGRSRSPRSAPARLASPR